MKAELEEPLTMVRETQQMHHPGRRQGVHIGGGTAASHGVRKRKTADAMARVHERGTHSTEIRQTTTAREGPCAHGPSCVDHLSWDG